MNFYKKTFLIVNLLGCQMYIHGQNAITLWGPKIVMTEYKFTELDAVSAKKNENKKLMDLYPIFYAREQSKKFKLSIGEIKAWEVLWYCKFVLECDQEFYIKQIERLIIEKEIRENKSIDSIIIQQKFLFNKSKKLQPQQHITVVNGGDEFVPKAKVHHQSIEAKRCADYLQQRKNIVVDPCYITVNKKHTCAVCVTSEGNVCVFEFKKSAFSNLSKLFDAHFKFQKTF